MGPLVSLLMGGIFYSLWSLLGRGNTLVEAILSYLAVANILLGIFNLIPGFPLDGGRILHAILWKITGNVRTATRTAIIVGQNLAYLFTFVGIFLTFSGHLLNGIWLILIGWFMLSEAQSTRIQSIYDTQLQNVTIGQVMNKHFMTVPANISLQRLINDYILLYGLRSAFVTQGGQLMGFITLRDIRHVPREQWAQTPVGHSMLSHEHVHTVAPQQNLREGIALMSSHDVNQLPVMQENHLVGVLSRDDVIRALEIRESLNIDQSDQHLVLPH